jgi:hypothetical protein
MRKRPSAALVVASIALMFSLAGTAEAALIITKNGQVGAHTIAGAKAPKGDHKNLIAGSIGTSDLHANSVTGAKVARKTIRGSDVADGTLGVSKLALPKIDFALQNDDADDSAPHHTVLSLHGLRLRLSCVDPGTGVGLVMFATATTGGTLRGEKVEGPANNVANSVRVFTHVLSTTPTNLGTLAATSGGSQAEWQLVYRDASRVISIALDAFADAISDVCSVHGTAVPAPN